MPNENTVPSPDSDPGRRPALALTGTLYLPGEPGYAEHTQGFNQVLPFNPAFVVAAADAADVQAAVRYAGEHGLPVAVVATAHQPSVPMDGAVLVSTRLMQGIEIDVDGRTGRAEAGVVWGSVVDEIGKDGLGALAGSTGGVGVVGYTTGGGLSPTLGRALGYAADHVLRFDIVTADGTLRTVDKDTEPDLFWAVRGGKDNFGIVTGITFRLFPVATLYGGTLVFPFEQTGAVLRGWRDWLATIPETMSTSVALASFPVDPAVPEPLRGKTVTIVRIAFDGSDADGRALVDPLRALGTPILDGVTRIPFTAFPAIHADPTDPVIGLEQSALLRELPDEAIDHLVALRSDSSLYLIEVRALGGALSRRPAVENAVGGRDAAFNLLGAGGGVPALPPTTEQIATLTRDAELVTERLRPWCTGGLCLNFAEALESDPESVRSAYDPAAYRRLRELKATYDPSNMFRINTNIPPA